MQSHIFEQNSGLHYALLFNLFVIIMLSMNVTSLFYDHTSRFSLLPKLGIPEIIDNYVTSDLRAGAIKLDANLTCKEITTPAWLDEHITLFRDFGKKIGVVHYNPYESVAKVELLDQDGTPHPIFSVPNLGISAFTSARDEFYIAGGNTLRIFDTPGRIKQTIQIPEIQRICQIARTYDGRMLILDQAGKEKRLHLLDPSYKILASCKAEITNIIAMAWDPSSDTFATSRLLETKVDLYRYNRDSHTIDFVETRDLANTNPASAIAYDALGHLVACSRDSIKIYSPDGTCVKALEKSGGISYQSCVVDADGKIAVYDAGHLYSSEQILIWDESASDTSTHVGKKRRIH